MSLRDQAYLSVHTHRGRKWTKQRAAAAASMRLGSSVPVLNTAAPGSTAERDASAHLRPAHRSTVGSVFQQTAASSWPAPQQWPKPDASLEGAGQTPLHRSFDRRLHDPGAAPRRAATHNPSKGERVGDTTLSNHGLLPGGGASTAALIVKVDGQSADGSRIAAVATPSQRLPPSRDAALDPLVHELARKRLAEPPFSLGWAPSPPRAHVPVDAHSVEEWKLIANDFDPIVTFALHEKKVSAWRAEALARPQPPPRPKPPLQAMPKSKHEAYFEVRAAAAHAALRARACARERCA